MRVYYLYKITNTANGKVNIGQSVNPRSRWYGHKKEAEREVPRMVIARAIKKYGSSGFLFELIACCCNQENTNEIETELVRQYDSRNFEKGYNISLGGMNAPKTEEWKQKVSKTLMGHEVSLETRNKLSKSHTGKILTDEHRKNIGIASSQRTHSEETRKKLSEINMGNKNALGNQSGLGYRHTEEAKIKIGNAARGKSTKNKGRSWKIIDGKRVWADKNE